MGDIRYSLDVPPDTILCFCFLFLLYVCSFCLIILIQPGVYEPTTARIAAEVTPKRWLMTLILGKDFMLIPGTKEKQPID